jgi:hypothetical protein
MSKSMKGTGTYDETVFFSLLCSHLKVFYCSYINIFTKLAIMEINVSYKYLKSNNLDPKEKIKAVPTTRSTPIAVNANFKNVM